MIARARSGNQQQTLGELVLACASWLAYGAQQSRPEEVAMIEDRQPDYCTCGTCGYTWDYNENPTPAHRCPREGEHGCDEDYVDPHACSPGTGYVVVELTNKNRGVDSLGQVFGPYSSEDYAEAVKLHAEDAACSDDSDWDSLPDYVVVKLAGYIARNGDAA